MTPKYGPFQDVLWFCGGVLVTSIVVNNWLLLGCLSCAAILAVYVTRVAQTPPRRPHNVIPVARAWAKTTY